MVRGTVVVLRLHEQLAIYDTFVVCERPTCASIITNFVPNRAFSRVDFPLLCGPMIATTLNKATMTKPDTLSYFHVVVKDSVYGVFSPKEKTFIRRWKVSST